MKWKPFVYVILLAGAMPVAAHAAVYEWTDDKGVVNLTDNPDKIPAQYRKKARKQDVETRGEPHRPAQTSVPEAAEKTEPSAPQLIDGHDAAWWHDRFVALRDDQKRISDGLPEKKERLTQLHRKHVIYQRSRDRVAYNSLNDEIQQDEARIKELQGSLEQLEAEADRLGVPKDWR
jgi:hypothetical protein